MNVDIEQLINKIASGVNEEWTTNEKMRYVYIELGKSLAKNVGFFYSWGRKMNDDNLSYDRLKDIYENDKVDNYQVICKSAAMLLKKVYDRIGIESKLMQSTQNDAISAIDGQTFDVYHWFLCCVGDDSKSYFMTLIPDLANIQNGWQTEHFATYIKYLPAIAKQPVYQGQPITESILTSEELAKLDMRIGYLKRKDMQVASATGPLDINDYIFYEGGTREKVSLKESPFVYDQIVHEVASQKGYLDHLTAKTHFYQTVFKFTNRDAEQINFTESSLGDLKASDIHDWCAQITHRIIDSTDLPDEKRFDCLKKLYAATDLLLEARDILQTIKNQEYYLALIENPPEKDKLWQEARIKENKEAVKRRVTSARSIIIQISTNYVAKSILSKKSKEYLLHQFEELFGLLMVLNNDDNPPMTARCNGIGEQLTLIDKVLQDIFGGKIIKDLKIVRVAVYNRESQEYNVIFQIEQEYFYYLNPRTGEFKIIPDFFAYASDNNQIILNDNLKDYAGNENNQTLRQ